jgi:hypothetical protein
MIGYTSWFCKYRERRTRGGVRRSIRSELV